MPGFTSSGVTVDGGLWVAETIQHQKHLMPNSANADVAQFANQTRLGVTFTVDAKGRLPIPSGILVGRLNNDQTTGFRPITGSGWVDTRGEHQVGILAYEVDDLNQDIQMHVIAPNTGFRLKANYLPQWADINADPIIKRWLFDSFVAHIEVMQ